MNYKYYILYKPETKQELEIRHHERWGWEYNWKNPGGKDRWAKFGDDMILQIEPNLKKYGYKMPQTIITEEEYEAALKRAWELWDSEPNTIKEHELNKWVDVIVAYEDKHYPINEPDIRKEITQLHLQRARNNKTILEKYIKKANGESEDK